MNHNGARLSCFTSHHSSTSICLEGKNIYIFIYTHTQRGRGGGVPQAEKYTSGVANKRKTPRHEREGRVESVERAGRCGRGNLWMMDDVNADERRFKSDWVWSGSFCKGSMVNL